MSPGIDLAAVYESCAPLAFRRARQLLGDEAEAWDVVHDVFERLARRPDRFRGDAHPMTYLYRSVTNACINRWQRRAVRSDPENVRLTAEAFGGGAAPGDDVEARELLGALWEELDDTDRSMFVLRFVDELPQEEIADILGVWRRTVGRRLARLRRKARQLAEGAP